MRRNKEKGQMVLEFVFSMIIVFLMIYGTVMIFRWAGVDLAERRISHDKKLTEGVLQDYGDGQRTLGPMKQIDPYFYDPIKMDAIWVPD